MTIIRTAKINGYFVADDKMYIRTHYFSYSNGDSIYIKHKELDTFLYWKVPFSTIQTEEGATFNTVEDCLNYIQNVILDADTVDPIKKETIAYDKRIKDGLEMSKNLMAELRVNSKLNGYPRAVNKYIENKLDKVKINIDRGWWVTALEELEAVTIESYFSQELYDRIHATINGYINLNYD